MESVLGRISTLFKAKINARLDSAENPNETLDLSYEQQVEQLQKVRRGIADVVTATSRLQLQLAHLQQDSGRFDTQATQALQADREDLARPKRPRLRRMKSSSMPPGSTGRLLPPAMRAFTGCLLAG